MYCTSHVSGFFLILFSSLSWTSFSERLQRFETIAINRPSYRYVYPIAKRSPQIQGVINSGSSNSGLSGLGAQSRLNTGQSIRQTLTPFEQATTAVQPAGLAASAQSQPAGQTANIIAQTKGQASTLTGQPAVSAPSSAISPQGKPGTSATNDIEEPEDDLEMDDAADGDAYDNGEDEMDRDEPDPEPEAPCMPPRRRRRRRCRHPYRFRGRRPRRPGPPMYDDYSERPRKQDDWVDFRGDPGYYDQGGNTGGTGGQGGIGGQGQGGIGGTGGIGGQGQGGIGGQGQGGIGGTGGIGGQGGTGGIGGTGGTGGMGGGGGGGGGRAEGTGKI